MTTLLVEGLITVLAEPEVLVEGLVTVLAEPEVVHAACVVVEASAKHCGLIHLNGPVVLQTLYKL